MENRVAAGILLTMKKITFHKVCTENTVTSTKWAVTNYEDWREYHHGCFANKSEKQVPEDILLP